MVDFGKVIDNVKCVIIGDIAGVMASGMQHDSRYILPGEVYFALHAKDSDCSQCVNQAVTYGAVGVVTEVLIEGVSLPQVLVDDVRLAYAIMSANYYGNPQKNLVCIGVVGTNGKTTCAKLICDNLAKIGTKCGNIGTLGCFVGGERIETNMTTPDPPMLYGVLRKMVDCGANHVVMEVSAHAIYLHKVDAIKYEVLLHTNISQDHLDYFGTMDHYSSVKLKFFNGHSKACVVNVDDEYADKLIAMTNDKVITYGVDASADLRASNIKILSEGQSLDIGIGSSIFNATTRLNGLFNVYNLLGAIGVVRELGYPIEDIIEAARELCAAEGRFNMLSIGGIKFVVDFAHTPDGLSKILVEGRRIAAGKRLIVVFGCGGERDKGKRPIMGKIASDLADIIIVTEDNSRSEDRLIIINEITSGIENSKAVVFVCPERLCAISQAVDLASEGDVIIIAGKGAEDTIDRGHEIVSHNDLDAVRKVMEGLNE